MRKIFIYLFGLFLFLLQKIGILVASFIIGKYLYIFFQPAKALSIILVIILWCIMCLMFYLFCVLLLKQLRDSFEKIDTFFYKYIDGWFDIGS